MPISISFKDGLTVLVPVRFNLVPLVQTRNRNNYDTCSFTPVPKHRQNVCFVLTWKANYINLNFPLMIIPFRIVGRMYSPYAKCKNQNTPLTWSAFHSVISSHQNLNGKYILTKLLLPQVSIKVRWFHQLARSDG